MHGRLKCRRKPPTLRPPERRHREDGGVLNPIALLEVKPRLKAFLIKNQEK